MFQALDRTDDFHFPGSSGQEPLDLVFIEGFSGETVIGIHDSEMHAPQPVIIDLCAGIPRVLACETDRIADTIDYGALRERLQRLLREHGVQLLEALAEQVARIAIDEFHAHWVRVRVVKPRKFEDTAAVGVLIERRRPVPSPAAARAATLRLIGHGLVPGGR
ncbi:MAG TPA: dihydroneopterin aldolase [Ramlibacter sp.]|uniref:dihydroneopterin aldolase n=1 Tax=Ramlibacter sp. TaxID=1917967 RepID=UPI002ED1001B